MLLHTPLYLAFLLIFALVFWLLPQPRWRKYWLLVGSYIFYLNFDWRFGIILISLTLANYFLGKGILVTEKNKGYYLFSLLVNLGTLAYFKYANFFLDNLGLERLSSTLHIILPIGVSFYTFQAISYTTELYRKKITTQHSLLDFALYLAFFPKLIAGPFIRPQRFFQQLNAAEIPKRPLDITGSFVLLLTGLFKKVVIADTLAILSNTAFTAAGYAPSADAFPAPLFAQGFYLYAIMIYADFSGYTDIARASAQFLGFNLPENFMHPYLSPSITQFWNRWHMSLTQWFREYIFYPISRRLLQLSERRYQRTIQITANLTTMLLIGFWHGASWTFIVWGLYHGVLLSLERIIKFDPKTRLAKVLGSLITFHLVGLGWVLFRAESFTQAMHFITGLLSFSQWQWWPVYLPSIVLCILLLAGVELFAYQYFQKERAVQKNLLAIVVTSMVFLIIVIYLLNFIKGADSQPFIYGQF